MLKPLDPQLIFIVDPGTVNQPQGCVSFALSLLGDEPGKLGNGTMASVTFRAEEVGASNVTISDCILVGPYSQVDHTIICNGVVEVVLPDLNHDGKVDGSDLILVVNSFGSYLGHERWNPACDFNQDLKINILDIEVVARAFGET